MLFVRRSQLHVIPQQMREAAEQVAALARLTRDLPGFLRTTVSLERAREHLRHQLATREQRLLAGVERGVYARPMSPYARLLRHAGCELGDFRSLVAHEGVEGALGTLADRGVHVTFDEMKGRREAVRGSQRFSFRDRDFDNPLASPHFMAYTGGTTGTPTRVGRSLQSVAEQAMSIGIGLDAHHLHHPVHVIWLTWSINKLLNYTKLGHRTEAWLHPLSPLPTQVRLGGDYLAALGRIAGRRLPRPAFLDLRQPERLVRWLAWRTRAGQRVMVTTTVSSAVRAAAAAIQIGIALSDVTFYVQGEPITPARKAQIEAAGARAIVSYGTTELMTAGIGCAAPSAVDDVHLFHDRYAAITRPRQAISDGPVVDALLFSTIDAHSSKILLNGDLGDYGSIDERACDCPLWRMGLRRHLSDVRSVEKLTGEGMTLVRTNLLPIIEQILPARFGGGSTDYQLVEQESSDGATRMVLRMHPSVGDVDEAAVRATLLDELARDSSLSAFMSRMWRTAGTVVVSREPPLVTSAGKSLPVHLLRPPRSGGKQANE